MLLTWRAGMSSGSAFWRWYSSISSRSSATTSDRSFLMNDELRMSRNPPTSELGTHEDQHGGLGADGIGRRRRRAAHRRWRR